MCPVCMATVALVAGGATSAGGLTALVVKKLHAKNGAKNTELITQTRGGQDESSESRVAS